MSKEELKLIQQHALAEQVSQFLSKHQDTMLQLTPDQVIGHMADGTAIMIDDGMEVKGFVRYFYHEITDSDQPPVVEVSSLIVSPNHRKNGLATELVQSLLKTVTASHPKVVVVAAVEQSNKAANTLFQKIAGEPLEIMPANFDVILGAGEAKLNVYKFE